MNNIDKSKEFASNFFIEGSKEWSIAAASYQRGMDESRNNSIDTTSEEFKNYLKRFHAHIEGIWRAEYGKTYWIITDDCGCSFVTDNYTILDDLRYTSGNYFRTSDEAEKACIKFRNILKEIRDNK